MAGAKYATRKDPTTGEFVSVKTRIIRDCKTCGKKMYLFPSRANREFCSHSCAAKDPTRKRFKRAKTPSTCHPERPVVGNGLCNQCYYKEYWQKPTNKAKRREYTKTLGRAKKLIADFGLTAEQWALLYERQKGKCAICERPIYRPYNKEGKRAAHVDHDHKTGRVRGLACYNCNCFIIARNTAETARKLIPYLESDFDGRNL